MARREPRRVPYAVLRPLYIHLSFTRSPIRDVRDPDRRAARTAAGGAAVAESGRTLRVPDDAAVRGAVDVPMVQMESRLWFAVKLSSLIVVTNILGLMIDVRS